MNHENITHVHPLTTADECIEAIRFLLGPTFADPISDELSRLNRERFQAPYGITNRKELAPYTRRIDRRKARHQKRNFLHDSIEEYYDDIHERWMSIEEDLYRDDSAPAGWWQEWNEIQRELIEEENARNEMVYEAHDQDYDPYYDPYYDLYGCDYDLYW